MKAKRFNRSFDKNDLQALLSELQSFPLLQKLIEAGGIHLHIHSIVNNGNNYGYMVGGSNNGGTMILGSNNSVQVNDVETNTGLVGMQGDDNNLVNQHNERDNNIQRDDVSLTP
ncbi:hypothetical protein EZS27_028879 [termite gut metagenome]|uniref:Uncharacterized protein n=1 Tax=termite gut metagenome TaxID=433724 RepID=A0A5J4QHU0_9ZZZZ